MDENDNVNAPPRMARQMNRETAGRPQQRMYLSFHSNSNGSRRGCLGLYNNPILFPTSSTPNQERLARVLAEQVNNSLLKMTNLPIPWFDRSNEVTYARSGFAFGEINNSSIGDEFDAAILEVGYHDNREDALLLHEPAVRVAIAKAAYEGVVRYMNEFDGAPLELLPQTPLGVSVSALNSGQATVSWSAVQGDISGYAVYISTNGFGFGHPIRVAASQTSTTVSNLVSNQIYYFRVAAINEGGESLPSAEVVCKRSTGNTKTLLVQASSDWNSAANIRQTAGPGIGGPNGGIATFDRVIPSHMNSRSALLAYGQALNDVNLSVDSCDVVALRQRRLDLSQYSAVLWCAEGSQPINFTAGEGELVSGFLQQGGAVAIFGNNFGAGRTVASGDVSRWDRLFSEIATESFTNVTDLTINAVSSQIPMSGTLAFGTDPFKRTVAMSALAQGNGSHPFLMYSNSKVAGIYFNPKNGKENLAILGFPFQALAGLETRQHCMMLTLTTLGVLK